MSSEQLDLFAAPVLADQPARDDAIHQIDTSFVVSAGAGAGKTETLIRRLEQVLDRGGDASRIVAITFTERAARDLVAKLRAKLPAALTPAVEQMTVGTIHSFCLGILRRHPLEAGLPPVFSTQDELLAGTDTLERVLRIRHRMFERIAELDDPAVREAIDVIVAENGIVHLDGLVRLVDQQWDRFDEVVLEPPVPWRDAVRRALEPVRVYANDRDVPLKLRVAIQELLPAIDACLQATTPLEATSLVPSVNLRTLGGGDGKAARDAVKAAINSVKATVNDHAVRHVLYLVVPLVLDEAHARYRSGSLSFDDILVLTRRLLDQHPAIRRRLRAEIDHLCVDEFQDTDVVQYDIVQSLTAPPASDEPEHTTTPVLFAVGDPKQSIYGFREADVSLFAALHDLPHLQPRQLTTNFRSRPAVLRWINQLFRSWFDADAGAGQVPFAPLDHHVTDAPATITVIGGAIEAPAELAARAQARDLARTVAAAHGSWMVRAEGPDGAVERPARFTDIAVLVRTRADLTHLEPALRRAGIPYVVEGGALLYDTREVRDLLRVVSAVNDTASPIKVVTALRTSVLALSDVELVEHRTSGGAWRLYGESASVGHPSVVQALTALRGWADQRHRTPVPELLDEIARRSATRAASLVDGAAATTWRRLRLVLDEARWWYEQTGGSLGEYLAWVAQRVENDDRSNVTTDETDEDAVHVLTVHAAKGLEFPIVMAAGLGRQRPSGDHVRASFGRAADGTATVAVKFGKLRTAAFDTTNDTTLDRLEAARLAYVACTRARDHLVVCLHHGAKANRTTAAELAPHLPPTEPLPDLAPVALVPPPEVPPFESRVDRPSARAITWKVRSSWSATQLRHRDDDAPVAVPVAPGAASDEPMEVADGPADGATDELVDTVPPAPGESVHSKPPRPFAALPEQIGRYGTRVGRAVHGVVQVLPFDDPLSPVPALVVQQCRAEEVPERFVPYVEQLVRSIASSEAFERMRRADAAGTVRREMYVGAEVDGEGVYGIIDAVWREDGRFVVVDFKTDHVLEAPEVLAERYRPQLAAYASALRAATGLEVAETLLCVARPDGSPALTVPIAV